MVRNFTAAGWEMGRRRDMAVELWRSDLQSPPFLRKTHQQLWICKEEWVINNSLSLWANNFKAFSHAGRERVAATFERSKIHVLDRVQQISILDCRATNSQQWREALSPDILFPRSPKQFQTWGSKAKKRRAELILRVSRPLLHSGALTFILTATTRQVTSGDTRGKRRKEKCLLRWQMHTNSYFVRTWQKKCTQVICDIRITNVTRQSWQRLKSCRWPYGLLTRGEDFNVTCSDF